MIKSLAFLALFVFVIGCNHSVSSKYSSESVESLKEVPFASVTQNHPELEWDSLLTHLKEITIITKEGHEITIDREHFSETFPQSPFTHPEEEGEMTYPFTVLLRSETDEPVAILISEKGVKRDDRFYRNELSKKLSQYIKEAAARYFFQQLNIERIMLTSWDIDRTIRMSDQKTADVTKKLKSADYIPGPPRIQFPLFPFYTMELYTGEKETVRMEVISPTLISLKQGESKQYYQTKDSLYGPLKEEMGFVEYPLANPKYLYQAVDIQIIDQTIPYEKTMLQINQEQMNDFEAKSLIHKLVRELAKGKQMEEWKREKNLPLITIQFLLGNTTESVEIYPDYFIYQQLAFSRPNILADLKGYVQKDSFLQKIRNKNR